MSNKPIGILGGTFDPVHHGHLRLALEIYEQFRLAEVRIIPLNTPPHRDAPVATAAQRLAMLQRAVINNDGLIVDDREIKRNEISYTIDTVRSLRNELAQQPLCLILGQDAFLYLNTWREWTSLFDFVHVIVATRPAPQDVETHAEIKQLIADRETKRIDDLHNDLHGHIYIADISLLDISSTKIRDLYANGQNPRYLLPEPVMQYIQEENIYPKS